MAQTDKQKIGYLGESLACEYLTKNSFSILNRNYLKPWGEIDIVAQKNSVIHFIEVKTVSRENVIRETGDSYEPEDNVHLWKLKRLFRVIDTYLLEKDLDQDKIDWQLDLITVFLQKETNLLLKLEYLPDIA